MSSLPPDNLVITVKKLAPDEIEEFISLIGVFEIVFEMENFTLPRQDHLERLLAREDFHVFVAKQGNRVVGGLTAYSLQQYYSTRPLVYVFDLAVVSELQYKGIGKKLMSAINSYCKETGAEEVFVQADVVDEHAVRFYKSTGGTPEEVVHFYYPLNPSSSE